MEVREPQRLPVWVWGVCEVPGVQGRAKALKCLRLRLLQLPAVRADQVRAGNEEVGMVLSHAQQDGLVVSSTAPQHQRAILVLNVCQHYCKAIFGCGTPLLQPGTFGGRIHCLTSLLRQLWSCACVLQSYSWDQIVMSSFPCAFPSKYSQDDSLKVGYNTRSQLEAWKSHPRHMLSLHKFDRKYSCLIVHSLSPSLPLSAASASASATKNHKKSSYTSMPARLAMQTLANVLQFCAGSHT